ncbi:MAG: type I secretion protein [Rhodobacteraceae bacterium]|nr:type I secretion protein [Paracoccaceae bacterium]
MNTITGTDLSEEINGDGGNDVIVGLGGDDQISGAAGEDVLVGDYDDNLLSGTEGAITFSGYADTSFWDVTDLPGGHSQMSQTVDTADGAEYQLTFEVAANIGAGVAQGGVEVLWNGTSIGRYDAEGGLFEPITVSFFGTGEPGTLTFQSVDPEGASAIDTSGPIFSYDKVMEVGGQQVTVAGFAEGQPNLYQVLNGTLVVFDLETQSYTQAGADATVVVNAIGFNAEDDMIYGIAVRNGVDALGNPVNQRDLVMIDANGLSYGMGPTPYRSWTGDFDDQGNLWAFEADMDYFMRIDVSETDENGHPVVERFNIPDELVTARVWDVAYDAATQTFSGVVRPSYEGGDGILMIVDVSGSEPQFELIPVTSTIIDGEVLDGLPAMTFGAAIIDTNGTLYVGGNSGDHDMDNSTGSSGGFYRVDTDPETGEAQLVLVADAPRSSSNDGAADPRSLDPFAPIDVESSILIQGIEMVQDPSSATSFNDTIDGNGGSDTIEGNLGDDLLIGSSLGDEIRGGVGDDYITGGAAPGSLPTGIISIYDEDGLRYDQFGNLLPEDDDVLYGGQGNDAMHGSAGHDWLAGGIGGDLLNGGSGSDTLAGGDGDDELNGGGQSDVLNGGVGNDSMHGGSGGDTMEGGLGDDTLKGASDNDFLDGGDGNDSLRGDQGDDTLEGGVGNDKLNGGSGNDELSGGDGRDNLNGSSGDDILSGGADNDSIYLGAGTDIATGGLGSDRFVFRSEDLDGSTDRITDFRRDGNENDRIDLTQLDVLGDATVEEWLAANVTLNSNGSVTVDLGGAALLFDSRNDGNGQSYYDEICDGFMF